jgi:hypothetical protein
VKLVIVSPIHAESRVEEFVFGLGTFLAGRGIDFHVLLCRQENTRVSFNPGVLRNAGFLYAMGEFRSSYVCFHEANLVPLEMIPSVDYSLPEDTGALYQIYGESNCLGPIMIASQDAFRAVNGYPNTCWDWDYASDTSLFSRCLQRGVRVDRSRFIHRQNPGRCILELPSKQSTYNIDKGLSRGRDSMFVEIVNPRRSERDGLLNCRFSFAAEKFCDQATLLKLDFSIQYGNVLRIRETRKNRVYILCLLSAVYRFHLHVVDSIVIETEAYRVAYWNQFLLVTATTADTHTDIVIERTIVLDRELIPTYGIEEAFRGEGTTSNQASAFPLAFREYDQESDNFEGIVLETGGARKYVI